MILEAAGDKVSLVLLDGSPSYVLTHQNAFKNRHSDNKVDDRDAFAYFVLLFKELDYQVVRSHIFICFAKQHSCTFYVHCILRVKCILF